uniref:HAT C-terminal dimerisation domain-containing protein n=1 Tax=Amphimedon queenslandica TaxID=400682 RepID=A0A1X7U5F9_AMPQE
PCFSHCLNLAVEKACSIAEVCKVIARCRRLVTHFHHSSKDTYILKQKQTDLHVKEQNVIQDVTTRWNSSYYMIARVVEQQQPLCAALLEVKRADLFPSDNEFIAMDVYLDVMKPLVTITEAISAQKWVTISTLRPLLHKLLKSHLIEESIDTSLAKKMKSEMNNNLSSRYTDNLLHLLSNAAFLHSRLKNLPFLSPIEVNELHDLIRQEAVQIAKSNQLAVGEIEIETDSAAVMPPTKKAK